ncbi:MAG TPA: bifunctional nuclease family protein [Gemmatimonadaceae bacterium]|jgi:bifunctional DNase/RNase|nr:bifunctional nuclease family protein [Gemmatimonadaceae bacterium]
MVEVKVARLGLDSTSNSYVVILQEKEGERLLPIWIGQPEAESIVMEMNHIQPPRPLTHDLCKRLIVGMGASLAGVHITRVQDNTYFAELQLQRGDDRFQIDARPSDSIAIALRLAAPIFAQESLLTAFAVDDGEEHGASEDASFLAPDTARPDERDLSAEQLKSHLEKLRPEDFGKFNP